MAYISIVLVPPILLKEDVVVKCGEGNEGAFRVIKAESLQTP
jgi:hypothetical protein